MASTEAMPPHPHAVPPSPKGAPPPLPPPKGVPPQLEGLPPSPSPTRLAPAMVCYAARAPARTQSPTHEPGGTIHLRPSFRWLMGDLAVDWLFAAGDLGKPCGEGCLPSSRKGVAGGEPCWLPGSEHQRWAVGDEQDGSKPIISNPIAPSADGIIPRKTKRETKATNNS